MATKSTITAVFALLKDASMKQSKDWEERDPRKIIASWCILLDDVPDGPLLVAAKVYIRQDEKWWPTPGQLLALIPPSGPPLLGWARIWDRVCTGLRNKGRDKPPGESWRLAERDDEHEAAMVAVGGANGWRRLCNGKVQDLRFAARDFERTFNASLQTTTSARRWIAAGGPPPLRLVDASTPKP